MKQSLFIICTIILFASCKRESKPSVGYKPIYSQNGEEKNVRNDNDNQIVKKPGKNRVSNNIYYVVDEDRGIQIYDVSDPEVPKAINFVHIFGIREMDIRDNYLYVNSINDLLILDASNSTNIVVVNRIENEFNIVNTNRPPEGGVFECIDPAKGTVIGWEKANLVNANCRL